MSPKILEFLRGAGVEFRTHAHQPLISFADAKAILPFDPGAMVKALAFRLPDGSLAIVAMQAAGRADYKKIADALGAKRADLRAASADDVIRDLDMQPGGIVPLPINGALVLFDAAVAALGIIYCGTGRNDATLEIAAAELMRIAGGKSADLVKAA